MKTIQQLLVCALLAALTALVVSTTLVVRALPGEVHATRAALVQEVNITRAALLQEVNATRCDLNRQIQDGMLRSERQVALLRTGVMAQAGQFRDTADRRIGDSLARVDRALAAVNTTLNTVEQVRQDLKPTLDQSAAITQQVNQALPLFLDCDHNPDCAFNRYVGVSKGIERAAMNFGEVSTDARGTLPEILSTWNQIGQSVAGTAANVDRLTKPHWYDRLLGYGLNAAVIYRNLNPITSLTVTGAQILSGRP